MNVVIYGNREAPGTTEKYAAVVHRVLTQKAVASMTDFKKATGKKWVRGFLNAVDKAIEPVVAVKNGRKVIGYRLASKPLQTTANGSFRGPDGRFVTPVSAMKAAKKKQPKRAKSAETVTEVPGEPVTVAETAAPVPEFAQETA